MKKREVKTRFRYAITHVSDWSGLRLLTRGKHAHEAYDEREEAERTLEKFRLGLGRVLSPSEVASLEVRQVECYENGDPVFYYCRE